MLQARMNQSLKMAVVLLGIAGLSACSKITNNLRYNLNLQTATVNFTIPPSSSTDFTLYGTQTNYYNIDSFIKANTLNAFGVSNISSAKMTSCTISLLDPNNAANFANFKSCTGSFYSDGNTTPYEVTISDNPDVYAETLNIPVDTNAELKGYLVNSTRFTYGLSGKLRRGTDDSLHCIATFTFKVRVQGL